MTSDEPITTLLAGVGTALTAGAATGGAAAAIGGMAAATTAASLAGTGLSIAKSIGGGDSGPGPSAPGATLATPTATDAEARIAAQKVSEVRRRKGLAATIFTTSQAGGLGGGKSLLGQ